MKQTTKFTFTPQQIHSRQEGISLLLTVLVLLALTIIAITVTNSNQTQSTLVRNNQFRLEAFNASYTEIDAQIDVINQRALSAGPPTYVDVLIAGDFNQRIEAGDNDLALLATAATGSQVSVARSLTQVYRGPCQVFGEETSVNTPSVICNEIRIDSDAELINTNVGSMQRQVYEYRSLGSQ